MGNLNCSNSTFDNQNEMKTEDYKRNKTYIDKTNDFKIVPTRSMIKSKTISPKKHLSSQEKNYIFLDMIKNKESKNDKKSIRHSFTPCRREKFKISSETGLSPKKEENKNYKNKKNKEKENKDGEDNDVNKKSGVLKKGMSSPLEVICEQIEDEQKILDTTKTYKNKEKNINDKNNNSLGINNQKENDKTQKDLILNDSNENNIDPNNNINYNQKLNNSNVYSDKSNNSDENNNINDNNKENSIFNKVEMKLCFNHTSSSKGEEENNNNIPQEDYNNNNYYYNNNYNEFQNEHYINNIDGFMDLENNKENKKNMIREKYKDLYKKRPFKNKYYKELNWKNINLDLKLLLTKKENDILLQGEFLVLNNILEINSFVHQKYTRYLTLTKHEINIYRSKEKYIYSQSPLYNISLFNITKCDILHKDDIKMFNNIKTLLLKFSLYIKLTTVTGMLIFEQSNNANKKYRFSNPFIKQNFNKPKSYNKYTNKPKDIELLPEVISKPNAKKKLVTIKNDKTKNNENTNKDKNKSGFYILLSTDNCELLLYLVAIINYLRK